MRRLTVPCFVIILIMIGPLVHAQRHLQQLEVPATAAAAVPVTPSIDNAAATAAAATAPSAVAFDAVEYAPTDPAAAAAYPGTEVVLADALLAAAAASAAGGDLSAQSAAALPAAEAAALEALVAAAGPVRRWAEYLHEKAPAAADTLLQPVTQSAMDAVVDAQIQEKWNKNTYENIWVL